MHAEAELLFPDLPGLGLGFSLEDNNHYHNRYLQLQEEEFVRRLQHQNGLLDGDNISSFFYDNYYNSEAPLPIVTSPGSNLMATTSVSEYDLGGEGDLFKAPELIMEEPPALALDPVTAAIFMISCSEDNISQETIRVEDMEAIESEQLLSDVFYDCKKDLLEESAIEETYPELADVKFPTLQMEEDQIMKKVSLSAEVPMQKSVSSGCLASKDWINGGPMKPSFLEFHEMDLGAAFRLRRAYSEGDIKTLGIGRTSLIKAEVLPPYERLLTIDDYKMEERRQKLSRYRKKKTRRNFGRKIKYACRKALADSQPRVRGRFAKTEECEVAKQSK